MSWNPLRAWSATWRSWVLEAAQRLELQCASLMARSQDLHFQLASPALDEVRGSGCTWGFLEWNDR